jgi:EAL domain-containing protein (putative c-di-GMP-specific phosphodiesterase class I)
MVNEPVNPESTQSQPGLSDELTIALQSDQFFLVYQPTIDLQTGAFVGVEALLRWRHPERGVVNPDVFIHDLEATGEIVPVGRWALRTACLQGAQWHARGYRFDVSVNVSVNQLEDDHFVQDVEATIAASDFDPASLVLEFSQRALLNEEEQSVSRLVALKSLGVRLAVDDFAPGHSPLANLERFPIDIVKLDRDFIAAITSSTEAASLVHTLVLLARSLNLQIIASGVEDAEQRRRLQFEEVDIGQGFLFSRPHEVAEIDRFLEDFAIFSGKPI